MDQKNLRSAIFLALFGCALSLIVPAQSGNKQRLSGHNCEETSGRLDVVADMYKSVRSESFLILISSYSGKQKYALATADNARQYLTKLHKVEERKLKIGIVPSEDKRSRIEFFINGRSVAAIDTTSAKRLCFGMGDIF